MKLIDTTNLTEYRRAKGKRFTECDGTNQRTLDQLRSRNVLYCLSTLISDLQKWQDSENEYRDELMDLCRRPGDPADAAADQDWYRCADLPFAKQRAVAKHLKRHAEREDLPEFVKLPSGWQEDVDTELECSEAEDWEALVREQDIDVTEYESEVYEHWLVDDHFAKKLKEHGEVVGEVFGLTVYGRCTTGQSISLDHVMWEIAAEMQILQGQKYDWSRQS